MSKFDIANQVFHTVGVVKKSDLLNAGLKEHEIFSLFKQGYIERVKRGYYKLSSGEDPKEECILSKLMKQCIVCAESALFHYGYSDFAPREWTIAVPYSFSRTVKTINEEIPVKAYYVQKDMFHLGETTGIFNGVTLPVYDRERTICDCFKYRTKLDNEIFNKAINAYVADDNKSLANLAKYAKEMGVYKKMMNVMEVFLNG